MSAAAQLEGVVRAAVEAYVSAVRGTGRTEQMLDAVHEGDAVIVHSAKYIREIERGLHKRGIARDSVRIMPASSMQELVERTTGRGRFHGRVHLDHKLVEDLFDRETRGFFRFLAQITEPPKIEEPGPLLARMGDEGPAQLCGMKP